jgi:hypothetical protein
MTKDGNQDRLSSLLEEALAEADLQGKTLAAALLAQCIEAIEAARSDSDPLA